MSKREIGDRGEQIALRFLERLGYVLVERNYRTRYGEIDLVMSDREALVFVEVKLRRSSSHGEPVEFVGPSKQAKLRATAEQYLADLEADFEEARFDIVGILDERPPVIRHVRDAF